MATITILDGNLGRDPEEFTFNLPSGTASNGCGFSVADWAGKDKQTGENITQWYDVRAYGDLGLRAINNLEKGDKVSVVGDLRVENYTAKDGTPRQKLVVNAKHLGYGKKLKPKAETTTTTAHVPGSPW